MNSIPLKLREEMSEDPYYSVCCITGKSNEKIEWHHGLCFGGRQIQEKECILPIIKEVHDQANNIEMKEKLDLVMLERMSEEQLTKYSKAVNLRQRLIYLRDKLST